MDSIMMCVDDENPVPNTPPSAPSSSVKTLNAAARKREQRLLSDPNAKVLSPTLVLCTRCNSEIKLSVKMAFDLYHWKSHRERCMRKGYKPPPKVQRGPKVDKKKKPARLPSPTTPPLTPDTSLTNIDTDASLPSTPRSWATEELPELAPPREEWRWDLLKAALTLVGMKTPRVWSFDWHDVMEMAEMELESEGAAA